MRLNTVWIMPGDVVLDYAFWRPTEAEIRARNIKCVVRYISYGSSGKRISKEEIAFLHSMGVAILIIFEWSATRANQGRAAGLADGQFSKDNLHLLDYPVDVELAALFAIDTNTIAGNIAQHTEYSKGFDEGLGDYTASGIYGDNDIISWCIANNLTILNWWAGASAWSSGKPPVEGVHVRQMISGSTPNFDNNLVLKPFKAWLPHEADNTGDIMRITNRESFNLNGTEYPPLVVKWHYNEIVKRHLEQAEYEDLYGPSQPSHGTPMSNAALTAIPDYQPGGSTVIVPPYPTRLQHPALVGDGILS